MTNNVLADGKLDAAEVAEIQKWINECSDGEIPAIAYIREELLRFTADGKVLPWELARLQLALERILPPGERAIARAARKQVEDQMAEAEAKEPQAKVEGQRVAWENIRAIRREDLKAQAVTDAQRILIANLGGKLDANATKDDATELISRLLAERDEAESEHSAKPAPGKLTPALAEAIAAHESKLRTNNKAGIEVSIPVRQPYEGKATMKQKDFLWNLGVKDQAVLDNLGKWQASALIDQLKAAQSSSGNFGAGVILILILMGVLVFAATR